MSERVVNILGVGNPLMRDDGVGVAAAEALTRRELPSWLHVYDAGLAVTDVLGGLDPGDPLIVIDAFRAGGEAGSIYQADLDDLVLAEDTLVGQMSLHEISVAPALRMESLSGRSFENVTVFGVEPGDVDWGMGLGPAVAARLETLVEAVLECARRVFYDHAGSATEPCTAAGECQS